MAQLPIDVHAQLAQLLLQYTWFSSLMLFPIDSSFLGLRTSIYHFFTCTPWSGPTLAGKSLLASWPGTWRISRTYRTLPRCQSAPRLQTTVKCFCESIKFAEYGSRHVPFLPCNSHGRPCVSLNIVHHGLMVAFLYGLCPHNGTIAQFHDTVLFNVESFLDPKTLKPPMDLPRHS